MSKYLREATPDESDLTAHPGYLVVVVDELALPDSGWRRADPPKSTGRCRWMEGRHSCGEQAVVELNRPVRKRDGRRLDRWWGYCPNHLFGRTFVDGRLEGFRLISDEERD